jgi:hypothetical protein
MGKHVTCIISGETFEISEQEEQFLQEKMKLALPRVSPKYREIFRMAWRNDRNLYKCKCDLTQKTIISLYPENTLWPVYEYDAWASEVWTPPHLDYDPNKNFFEQYQELQQITPRVNIFAVFNENCEYVNGAFKNKNCYLIFVSDRNEDCYYVDGTFGCKDCADCSFTHDSELCYEACDLRACYYARYCYLCENSSNIAFCFDLKGCRNCLFCSGLRDQEYCVYNQKYSREEYKQKLQQINFSSHQVVEKLKEKFFAELISQDYSKMINCEDCDGNFLINCKNCHECFDVDQARDCMYVRIGANRIRDAYHSYAVVNSSDLIYNCVSVAGSYNCHNVIGCWNVKDSAYSEFLRGCNDCLGCISLKRKQHCILNKQYSAEHYAEIKQNIVCKMGENWGSNFPISLAPFSYQESAYRDFKSLRREEVESLGWRWGKEKTEDVSFRSSEQFGTLPDRSSDFSLEQTQQIFRCQTSSKPYKIVPQELKLIQRLRVPLPRHHYDLRFRMRTRFRK